MSRRKAVAENIEEVKMVMEMTKDARIYRKLQSIYLRDTQAELTIKEIAKITQYSEDRITKIHTEYRKHGMKSVEEKRGGRHRSYMSHEEEGEILKQFEEEKKAGKIGEISRIKRAFEAVIGHEVHETTIYRILDKHGFRKITPYQRHKKGDTEEQENFKKTLDRQ
jgi:transposase